MNESLEDDLLDFHNETYVPEKPDRQIIIRAPFSIPGSKTRSIEHLKIIPYRKKWIDVFTGSGVVTFNRVPSTLEVMNDRYGGIVAFYRCLKDRNKYHLLKDWLEATVHSREDFYHCRNTWCSETDDVIRAAKWYYMIRTSVIGKGDCFARQTNSTPQFPVRSSLKLLTAIHLRLINVIIENLDFETCINDFHSNDCVTYLDPPYIGTDPSVYETKWTRDDLSRLLKCIANGQGYFALSGYPDEQIDAETFWTNKISWQVCANSEVKAFLGENGKKHLQNVQEVDYATECLWIKDS